MGFFTRSKTSTGANLKDVQSRGNPENPSTPLSNPAQWVFDLFGGGVSDAGVTVNSESAMRFSAVWGCLRVLGGSMGMIPLDPYQRLADGTKKKLTDHYLYWHLHNEPNSLYTAMVFKETSMNHLLMWGNSYAHIIRSNTSRMI